MLLRTRASRSQQGQSSSSSASNNAGVKEAEETKEHSLDKAEGEKLEELTVEGLGKKISNGVVEIHVTVEKEQDQNRKSQFHKQNSKLSVIKVQRKETDENGIETNLSNGNLQSENNSETPITDKHNTHGAENTNAKHTMEQIMPNGSETISVQSEPSSVTPLNPLEPIEPSQIPLEASSNPLEPSSRPSLPTSPPPPAPPCAAARASSSPARLTGSNSPTSTD